MERPRVLSWHFPGLEIPGKRPQVLESPGNLRHSRNTEKDVFRLVTSVGQSENFWVPVRNRIGGLRNFFFVPRSWQDEKHLSIFLYRAQNFPSLLFHFQAMQLSEFVRNVCRPYGELILKSWEWTGWRWNLESWKNRSRSWKGPLNFVFEKRYETCNQANVHFRATLSTIFYQTWLVVYQTPTVVLKRNPSETSWGMKIYRMNLYNNLLRGRNKRNCILKHKS